MSVFNFLNKSTMKILQITMEQYKVHFLNYVAVSAWADGALMFNLTGYWLQFFKLSFKEFIVPKQKLDC